MENNENTKKQNYKESAWGFIKLFLYALVLAFLIKHFVFNTTLVIGQSMEPTLKERDRLICLVYPLYFSEPKRGDIVVLDAPDNSGNEYIKRVIGKSGDKIELSEGKVIVNGLQIEEDYIEEGIPTLAYEQTSWEVGEDELFVIGDNRHPGKSSDSRIFGPVKKNSIRSIAVLRYYPFNSSFGTIK